MKINSCYITNAASLNCVNTKKFAKTNAITPTIAPSLDKSRPTSVLLSFTSNAGKNLSQTASISSEYQGTLNTVYKVGGEGNVAGEAAVALQEHGKMDFRTFVPYYSPENSYPDGNMGFIKIKRPLYADKAKKERVMWSKPKFENGKPVMNGAVQATEQIPAYTFESVPIHYKLKEGEQFVIHEPVQEGKEWMTGYQVLKETGISGTVKGISEDLVGAVSIPYKMFAIENTGTQVKGKPFVYVIHTPELAVYPKAYGGAAYAGKMFDDYMYAIFSRASVDAIEQMNTPEFGNFNPGNFWLHDRQAFPAMAEIADRSSANNPYWTGIKAHASYHNPGRDYQGHYVNPIDFFRITGTDKDLAELKKNPADYEFVKEINDKISYVRSLGQGKFAPEEILTSEELEKLKQIFDPLYGDFKDEFGEYNLCKIPVVGVRKNPFNFSAGTVSRTYGKEMKNHNTKEIAYGLTSDFASIPTVDIVNGSSAKNLHLDTIGMFGSNNGFTDTVKAGFTPLTEEIIGDTDKLFAAKQANKKWLLDTIGANSKDNETLANLFFSKGQIKSKATVLGSLSSYKDGDVLFIGWGRPDTQKGFPTTLEGFLDYFKNPNVPASTKEHAKVLLGAGPWPEDAADWKVIQKQMQEIQELDGGRYKNNVCYLNGFFSNRIVACADYSNITSRYEPCGITPLESYAGGTPVISNNTGGSPDFIQPIVKGKPVTNETGFLTKNAYLVNPEVIGAKEGITGTELDAARRIALGKENSECIEEAMELFTKRPDDYKKLMMNAVNSKTDWHENIKFNQGKSALELYKEKVWGIDKDNVELAGQKRNSQALNSLKGKIQHKLLSFTSSDEIKNAAETVQKNGIFTRIRRVFSTNMNKGFGTLFVGLLGFAAIMYGLKRVIQKAK